MMANYTFNEDKNKDDYVFIDGVSNTNRDDLAILFLKNNISLFRSENGVIGYDKNNLFEKTMINGGWNVPLERKHEVSTLRKLGYTTEEALAKATIYGNGIGYFVVPFDKKGFISINGEKVDIALDSEDNEKRIKNKIDNYYVIYKLTPIGEKFFEEKRHNNEIVKASTYYDWDGDELDDISIGSAKIVNKITPITNSIVENPAFKTGANYISCNSNDAEEKKMLDNNKVNSFFTENNMTDNLNLNNNSANNDCSKNDDNIDKMAVIDKLIAKIEENNELLNNFLSNQSTNEENKKDDDKQQSANEGDKKEPSLNESDDLKLILAEIGKKLDEVLLKINNEQSANEGDKKDKEPSVNEENKKDDDKQQSANEDNKEQSVNSAGCVVVNYNI